MIASSLLLMAGVGFGIWKVFFSNSEITKAMRILNSSYREQRPLQSRISALAYAPFSTASRIDEAQLRQAESILLDAKNHAPSSPISHALGQLYLTQKQFDKAIQEFDEASKNNHRDPLLLSDLGAAWLEKAGLTLRGTMPAGPTEENAVQALDHSLTYLNQALTQDHKLVEAIFNRALCFEYLRLPVRAQDDWTEYLKNDSTSPWANEARDHLKLLQNQINQSFPTKEQLLEDFLAAYKSKNDQKAWQLVSVTRDDLSGTSISQQLSDSYLNASLSGNSEEASRQLDALSYVAELEVKNGDEYYNRDVVTIYKSLTPAKKSLVLKARNLMKTGFELYEHSPNNPDMMRVFSEARDAFAAAEDHAEVNYASFWIAYYLGSIDTQRTLALLTDLASTCQKHRYRWLLMRTTQYMSSQKYTLKEYSKGIEYSLNALTLAEQLGDDIGKFNALDMLTEVYRVINNYPQALNSISRSQPLLECCAFNQIKVWRHYGIVAVALYSAGSYSTAIEYQREALRRALIFNDPDMICLSYAHLGLMHEKLGEHEEALKTAKLGYETASHHADQSSGKRMMAYTAMQLGHLYREIGDCDSAIKSYDESISIYEGLKFPTHLYQAHKGRFVCYVRQQNHELAGKELETTLALIDSNRSNIFEDDNRNKFFDIEQNIYDLGISYTYETLKDNQKAFVYSEASRARSLLDLILSAHSKTANTDAEYKTVFQPLSLAEIQRRLSPRNQILEYTVLEDKTLIWLITQRDFQVAETKISRPDLQTRVESYLRSISDPRSTDVVQQGRELFDLLVRPVESWLDPQKQLDIVPDKFLNSVPFNSLSSSTSGRFLIDDYTISYAPSATVLIVAAGDSDTSDRQRPENILAVGNPSFDLDAYPTLFNLADAAREAADIRKFYSDGPLLVGRSATKQRVLAEIGSANVVHLALHSIEEPNAEMHSRLVFARDTSAAKSDSPNDALEAREIYELRLPQTRLVVLSACQTATGRYYGGEGTFSLARAFLVSGVPVIVASLWPVDSQSTAQLMVEFHRHRKQQQLSTAEALRSSQLAILRAADTRFHHPFYWAAFSVFGAAENSPAPAAGK